MSSPRHLSFERTVRRIPTDEPNTQDNAQISHFSVYKLARPPIRTGRGFSASWASPARFAGKFELLRRNLHAYRDHGAVGRHRTAAGGGAFGGDVREGWAARATRGSRALCP